MNLSDVSGTGTLDCTTLWDGASTALPGCTSGDLTTNGNPYKIATRGLATQTKYSFTITGLTNAQTSGTHQLNCSHLLRHVFHATFGNQFASPSRKTAQLQRPRFVLLKRSSTSCLRGTQRAISAARILGPTGEHDLQIEVGGFIVNYYKVTQFVLTDFQVFAPGVQVLFVHLDYARPHHCCGSMRARGHPFHRSGGTGRGAQFCFCFFGMAGMAACRCLQHVPNGCPAI